MQKDDSLLVFKILSVIAFIISAYLLIRSATYIPNPIFNITKSFVPVSQLSTVGYVEVKPDARVVGDIGIVTLTGGCYQVSGRTEAWIAQSIIDGLANKTRFRPDAHDVFRDALNTLGVKVVMVKVVDIKNSTFIGRLILQQGSKLVSLDIRPSNGCAIAIRTGAPIYMRKDLMEKYGKKIC